MGLTGFAICNSQQNTLNIQADNLTRRVRRDCARGARWFQTVDA